MSERAGLPRSFPSTRLLVTTSPASLKEKWRLSTLSFLREAGCLTQSIPRSVSPLIPASRSPADAILSTSTGVEALRRAPRALRRPARRWGIWIRLQFRRRPLLFSPGTDHSPRVPLRHLSNRHLAILHHVRDSHRQGSRGNQGRVSAGLVPADHQGGTIWTDERGWIRLLYSEGPKIGWEVVGTAGDDLP